MKVWAVVPVKPFALAKQRLAEALHPWERVALSQLMLQDTLEALAQVPALTERLVVTADRAATPLARCHGAEVLMEPSPEGLNTAVSRAARHVQQRGGEALLVVPGDVPGLRAVELVQLVDGHAARRTEGGALSLVPAHDGDGTNAWMVSPPLAVLPSFGPGSFQRHCRDADGAGLPVNRMRLAGLGLDLDHASDLHRFATDPRHRHTRTARFLAARLARILSGAAEPQTTA